MLTSLTIDNFRAFKHLQVEDLGRVNLIVGENNCGKTCVLEAAELLLSPGDPAAALARSIKSRREIVTSDENRETGLLSVQFLFHGFQLTLGSTFQIRGTRPEEVFVRVELTESNDSTAYLKIHRSVSPGNPNLIELRGRGFQAPIMNSLVRVLVRQSNPPVNFAGTERPDMRTMTSLWDRVALTAEEPEVTSALRLVDSRVERIAFLTDAGASGDPTSPGVYVKCSGHSERIPLGTLGEGLTRLLNVSLTLASSENGFALIDEIDTGLHYSVMEKMWKMVIETARRLNVQVFATTHSLDCVRALGWLCEDEPGYQEDVRVHRIDKGMEKTVVFTPEDLAVAYEHRIEVR